MKAKYHYLQYWAHRMVKLAILHGDLVRPDTCSRCGQPHAIIEAHHHDYSLPLDVEWLCRDCHLKLHGRLLSTHQKLPDASKVVRDYLEANPEALHRPPRDLAVQLGVGKSTVNNVQREILGKS